MNLRPRRSAQPEVNITPLIDVVFLLLIFFMVSTTFDRETEIEIELPEASTEEKRDEEAQLEITIDAQGRYYVNQKAVINTRIETLKRAIEQAAKGNKKQPVTISADGKSPHQAVVTAMDAAGQLGFVHFTFATKQAEGQD